MVPREPEARHQMISRMLRACIVNDALNDWELNFLASVDEQFISRGDLTDRQCAKLEQIYDKLP